MSLENPAFRPADLRLEVLGDHAACFIRDSGVTHIIDAAACFIVQQVVASPGIDRGALLARLQGSFDDEPEALASLLDQSLTLLLRSGLLRGAEAVDGQ